MGEKRKPTIEKIRRKKVRTQQNLITLLCLACIVFSVTWIVETVKNGRVTTEPANAKTTSSQRTDESSSTVEESSSETEDGSEPVEAADDLSDAVFVGDSRTVGLMNSTTYPKATFYCAVGLNIDTALTDADITLDNGNMGTVVEALKQKQFSRVYISFGTNEMGWPYIDTFKEHYKLLVDTVMEAQPDAKIYCVGILPVTASQDAKGESVNNTNAKTFSTAISEVAAEVGAEYLDCSAAVADENGYLPEDASTDGIHMTSEYCLYWQDYIVDNS